MIIYPPLIADTIPAFLYDDTEVIITIPFTQNPAVPAGIPLQIQIKDYFSSTIITKSQTAQQASDGQVSFRFKVEDVDKWPIQTVVNGKIYKFPVVGQYYKIQIAYDDGDGGVELTYSSAALGKCIDNHIDLNITDVNGNMLSSNEDNANPITYVGNYIRSQVNEPLYSYRFDFKNEAGEIIETSGEIVWNNQNDECVFEGSRISKNTPIKVSTSLSNQRPVFTSYVDQQGWENIFDMDGKYIDNLYYQSFTYYSDTILLSNYLSETYNNYFWFNWHWDTSPNTPLINTGLGYWHLSETDFKMLQKYPICATKSIQIQKLERDNNSATIEIGERSLTISSIYQSTTPTYNLKHELQMGQIYTMTFSTTTINGYQNSISVNIVKGDLKEPNFPVKLEATSNKDMGNNEIKVEIEKYAIKEKSVLNLNSTSAILGIQPDYLQEQPGVFYPIVFSEDNITLNQKYSNLIGSIKINNNIFYTELALIDDGRSNFLDITHKSKYLPQGEYTIKFTNFYYFSDGINQPYISFDNMELSLDNTNQLGVIIRQHNDINETVSANLLYNDNTVTFGEVYKYGWQENYQEPASIQWHDSPIILYSDYMFLSDKDKQLKISFNPKVSSMKETILETKQDTIGGKYPIFYRNSQVRYREIPISGLISYLMDDYEQFATNEELGLAAADTARTTSLTNYNIIAERKFREKVLNWLNDGKPKLFRSMTEGTFIVRLMNVSLSPNDTVGRMIWTFSATAYEIDENTYDNLKKYKLIEIEEEE